MPYRRRCLFTLLSTLFAAIALPAQASLISLTPDTTGAIRVSGGLFGSSGSHSRPLYTIRGYQIAQAQIVTYASYLIFDTSGLDFTPTYGTLSFSVNDTLDDLAGPGPLELWGLDAHTPADVLALPTGSLGAQLSLGGAIAGDLVSGTSLAPDIFGPDGPISFELNGAALTQIAGASGLFGVGLYDNRFGALIGGIDVLTAPTLFLSNEIGVPVPAPATPALLALALAALDIRRRLAAA